MENNSSDRYAAYCANTDPLFLAYLAAKESGSDEESVAKLKANWLAAREQVKKDYPNGDTEVSNG